MLCYVYIHNDPPTRCSFLTCQDDMSAVSTNTKCRNADRIIIRRVYSYSGFISSYMTVPVVLYVFIGLGPRFYYCDYIDAGKQTRFVPPSPTICSFLQLSDLFFRSFFINSSSLASLLPPCALSAIGM